MMQLLTWSKFYLSLMTNLYMLLSIKICELIMLLLLKITFVVALLHFYDWKWIYDYGIYYVATL